MNSNVSVVFEQILKELDEARDGMCIDGPPDYHRGFSSGHGEAQAIIAALAKKHGVDLGGVATSQS